MENKKEEENIKGNNSNQIKYSKIDSNEDSYLNIKENKTQNELKINKDNLEYNIDNNQENPHKKKGILNNRKPYYFYMKLGNTHTFFGDKDASPLIVIGPHWPMYVGCCAFITLAFLFFFRHFWVYMNIVFKLIGIIIFITFFLSYSYTSLMNPGIPKYDENAILGKPRENYRFCGQCCVWVSLEENACHCFECNVCYEGYDHHCPWTGKCIAKNNVKYFYTFIVSILCIFCYFVTALTHAQHNIFIAKKKK